MKASLLEIEENISKYKSCKRCTTINHINRKTCISCNTNKFNEDKDINKEIIKNLLSYYSASYNDANYICIQV